ncbi:MAG: helix-turn-helix transcriptional regulator [Brachyspira sp.]|nr:helix-turn-helix transcriptional regulator [Brachyspira sp.]
MNEYVVENFIRNLRSLRKRRGCSCKLLSELIGCDSSYISKVENGRIIPPLDKIIAVANYFEVDFLDLFK